MVENEIFGRRNGDVNNELKFPTRNVIGDYGGHFVVAEFERIFGLVGRITGGGGNFFSGIIFSEQTKIILICLKILKKFYILIILFLQRDYSL